MDQIEVYSNESVAPMSNVILGYPENDQERYKATNYKNERKIYRKVKVHYNNHMYLLNRLQTKLNHIQCNVTLEVLSEMDAPAIVMELIGEKPLVEMMIIDPNS